MNELFGDSGAQIVAVLTGDDGQHQVHDGVASGGGEAVAVNFEQLGADLQLGKLLDEAAQALPMDGALVTIQQAGAGEDIGARADGAKMSAETGQAAEPGINPAVVEGLRPKGGADDGLGQPAGILHGAVGHERNSIAGFHG